MEKDIKKLFKWFLEQSKIVDFKVGEDALIERALREYKQIKEKEIVICAAIKSKDGQIARGHRHGDCLRRMQELGIDRSNSEQGFITSRNRFVSREEGRKLQDAAGIKSISEEGYVANTLFSEDLY